MEHSYKEAMDALRFHADFLPDTMQRIEQPQKNRKRGRPILIAACLCMCLALAFGTAYAVFPEFRSLFVQPSKIAETETVNRNNWVTGGTQQLENVTVHYVRPEGTFGLHGSATGFISTRVDGKDVDYTLTDDYELIPVTPTHVQQTFTLDGKSYQLDYDYCKSETSCWPICNSSLVRQGIIPYAMPDANTLCARVCDENGIAWPIRINLTSGEAVSPLAACKQNLPQAAQHEASYVFEDTTVDYLTSDLDVSLDEGGALGLATLWKEETVDSKTTVSAVYYALNGETGEVQELCTDSGDGVQAVVLYGGIYFYYNRNDGRLYQYDAQFKLQSAPTGDSRVDWDGCFPFVQLVPDHRTDTDLTLVDILTGERIVLAGYSQISGGVMLNNSRTRLAFSHFTLTPASGLGVSMLSVLNMQTGQMSELQRDSSLHETMCGWFDDNRFVIGCTNADNETLLCFYEFDTP